MSNGILFRDTTAVPVSGQVQSDWLDVRSVKDLVVLRAATGGAYALEVDWSHDKVTTDVTETLATVNNDSVRRPVAHLFARFRVRNTSAVAAITNHATVIRVGR